MNIIIWIKWIKWINVKQNYKNNCENFCWINCKNIIVELIVKKIQNKIIIVELIVKKVNNNCENN